MLTFGWTGGSSGTAHLGWRHKAVPAAASLKLLPHECMRQVQQPCACRAGSRRRHVQGGRRAALLAAHHPSMYMGMGPGTSAPSTVVGGWWAICRSIAKPLKLPLTMSCGAEGSWVIPCATLPRREAFQIIEVPEGPGAPESLPGPGWSPGAALISSRRLRSPASPNQAAADVGKNAHWMETRQEGLLTRFAGLVYLNGRASENLCGSKGQIEQASLQSKHKAVRTQKFGNNDKQ